MLWVSQPVDARQVNGKTVWDGVFSAPQAARGQDVFQRVCLECHEPAEFTEGYLESWADASVNDFLEFVRTEMPEDNPGRLSRQEYVDVLAYIFSINSMPAGAADMPLASEALSSIRIVTSRRPAAPTRTGIPVPPTQRRKSP